MNCVLIGLPHAQYSHIRLSPGALQSSDENMIMVFLLSVLPSFCIKQTIHTFPIQILRKIIKHFSDLNIFSIYVIVIFNLNR